MRQCLTELSVLCERTDASSKVIIFEPGYEEGRLNLVEVVRRRQQFSRLQELLQVVEAIGGEPLLEGLISDVGCCRLGLARSVLVHH